MRGLEAGSTDLFQDLTSEEQEKFQKLESGANIQGKKLRLRKIPYVGSINDSRLDREDVLHIGEDRGVPGGDNEFDIIIAEEVVPDFKSELPSEDAPTKAPANTAEESSGISQNTFHGSVPEGLEEDFEDSGETDSNGDIIFRRKQ